MTYTGNTPARRKANSKYLSKQGNLTVRISIEDKERLEHIAKQESTSVNNIVRTLISDYLDSNKDE